MEQKLISTELNIWNSYLDIKFKTNKFSKDLKDLSLDPNTFTKIFAHSGFLTKKLEPTFSNPPLIVMKHLHMREIPKNESGNLDKFLLSNEELIYKKELDVLALLRYIHNREEVESDTWINVEGLSHPTVRLHFIRPATRLDSGTKGPRPIVKFRVNGKQGKVRATSYDRDKGSFDDSEGVDVEWDDWG